MRRMIFKWILGLNDSDIQRLKDMRVRYKNTGTQNEPAYGFMCMSVSMDVGWLLSKIPS